ncbi:MULTISPECIES: hypothetical protein [unclassified Xanthobacter]|uniref:hypothetical protein n=1 Tax=unclassified Xanthobacter TaxID=2623496 RepID=UPI001EE0951B|nr:MULTISPECIES: hypothetical protein [unclassified Xanthobacter]
MTADDLLAAELVIGTLEAPERAQARARLQRDPDFARLVRRWERDLAPLHELISPIAPPPAIWNAIAQDLARAQQAGRGAAPASAPPPATGGGIGVETGAETGARSGTVSRRGLAGRPAVPASPPAAPPPAGARGLTRMLRARLGGAQKVPASALPREAARVEPPRALRRRLAAALAADAPPDDRIPHSPPPLEGAETPSASEPWPEDAPDLSPAEDVPLETPADAGTTPGGSEMQESVAQEASGQGEARREQGLQQTAVLAAPERSGGAEGGAREQPVAGEAVEAAAPGPVVEGSPETPAPEGAPPGALGPTRPSLVDAGSAAERPEAPRPEAPVGPDGAGAAAEGAAVDDPSPPLHAPVPGQGLSAPAPPLPHHGGGTSAASAAVTAAATAALPGDGAPVSPPAAVGPEIAPVSEGGGAVRVADGVAPATGTEGGAATVSVSAASSLSPWHGEGTDAPSGPMPGDAAPAAEQGAAKAEVDAVAGAATKIEDDGAAKSAAEAVTKSGVGAALGARAAVAFDQARRALRGRPARGGDGPSRRLALRGLAAAAAVVMVVITLDVMMHQGGWSGDPAPRMVILRPVLAPSGAPEVRVWLEPAAGLLEVQASAVPAMAGQVYRLELRTRDAGRHLLGTFNARLAAESDLVHALGVPAMEGAHLSVITVPVGADGVLEAEGEEVYRGELSFQRREP